MPVVSHVGQKIAFRAFLGSNRDDQVHEARLNGSSNLTILSKIDLNLPANVNISGIDFSGDDNRLYISTQAQDVPGSLISRKQEVFSVRLDGTDQRRLTINTDSDTYPSAVPQCNGLPTPFDLQATATPAGIQLTWKGVAMGNVHIERTPGTAIHNPFSIWYGVVQVNC